VAWASSPAPSYSHLPQIVVPVAVVYLGKFDAERERTRSIIREIRDNVDAKRRTSGPPTDQNLLIAYSMIDDIGDNLTALIETWDGASMSAVSLSPMSLSIE
jgi:hypothetical protein